MSMHPPPDPDELASDLVDGLLPADQAARLRSDPAIAARVEAIEAARAALRVSPPPSPGAVDRAIAATFAALDRGPAADVEARADERPPPPVTRLHSVGAPTGRPAAPQRSSSMRWLAAAAAIVLLGLVTIGVLSGGSDSGDSSSSSDVAASAAPEAGSPTNSSAAPSDDETLSSEENGDASSGGALATTTPEAPPSGRRDLGAVDSASELADQIRAQGLVASAVPDDDPDAQTDLGDLGSSGSTSCAGLTAAGDTSRGESVFVADAVLAGDPVRVHLYDTGDGDLQLVATDESCVDVVDMPYVD